MKKSFKFSVLFLGALASFALGSCGSDDAAPTPETDNGGSEKTDEVVVGTKNVFVNGIYASTPDYDSIKVDANGRVTTLYDGSRTVEFTYADATRATTTTIGTVTMQIKRNGVAEMTLTMTLNDNGFVKHCDEKYSDPTSTDDTWDFEYDSAGHMTYMARSESDEKTYITYNSDGDLTDVKRVDKDETVTSIITYGTTENTYAVMLFDDNFCVDLDEMCYAFCAGLLGRATTHLPVSCVEKIDTRTYTRAFVWSFYASNAKKPSEVKITETSYDGSTETYTHPFN